MRNKQWQNTRHTGNNQRMTKGKRTKRTTKGELYKRNHFGTVSRQPSGEVIPDWLARNLTLNYESAKGSYTSLVKHHNETNLVTKRIQLRSEASKQTKAQTWPRGPRQRHLYESNVIIAIILKLLNLSAQNIIEHHLVTVHAVLDHNIYQLISNTDILIIRWSFAINDIQIKKNCNRGTAL